MSNWKHVANGEEFIKVVGFPVPADSGNCVGEGMWVKKVSGTDNDGTGTLANTPFICEEVSFGDLVKYAGGTDEIKTSFVEKIEEE